MIEFSSRIKHRHFDEPLRQREFQLAQLYSLLDQTFELTHTLPSTESVLKRDETLYSCTLMNIPDALIRRFNHYSGIRSFQWNWLNRKVGLKEFYWQPYDANQAARALPQFQLFSADCASISADYNRVQANSEIVDQMYESTGLKKVSFIAVPEHHIHQSANNLNIIYIPSHIQVNFSLSS